MITSDNIKAFARDQGADIVGVAPIDRWEGAPLQMDPRQIMPDAKSVIAMGFRVMRGSLRGIEQGTFFSNYSSMGYGGITYLYMPIVVINMCKLLEDFGYESLPMGHQSDWRAIANEETPRPGFSEPVAPGRAAPDVAVHLRIAAYVAGLGEIGYSKVFLTPEFGPRQRMGIVITEAELEPDPIYSGPKLCNKCMACVDECPGNAISRDKTVKVTVAGNELEWGELDCEKCDIAFRGGKVVEEEGVEGDYMEPLYGKQITRSEISPFYRKPRNLYNTGQAVCGGRGCMRACMVGLEKRGLMKNKFHKPFRREKPWTMDWDRIALEKAAAVDEKEAD